MATHTFVTGVFDGDDGWHAVVIYNGIRYVSPATAEREASRLVAEFGADLIDACQKLAGSAGEPVDSGAARRLSQLDALKAVVHRD